MQLDCAFGKKDYADFFGAGLLFGTPAATGGQARLTVVFGRGHARAGPPSVVRCTRKQVPRLRIAIDEANRNAPLGMTRFDVASDGADRDAPLGMTGFDVASDEVERDAPLGITGFDVEIEANRDAPLGMTKFEMGIEKAVRPPALGMTGFLASC